MNWKFSLVRRAFLASICTAATLLAVTDVSAQTTDPNAAKKAATSQNLTLLTKDNVSLHATYFPSTAGRNAPVAVLLHGKGGNRLAWQTGLGATPGFAQALQMNGFAVLCVDLRQHGANIAEGVTAKNAAAQLLPRDYQAMVSLDMDAVKRFLYDEHQKQALNMNKLGVVAADFSTGIALMFAEIDWLKEPYDDNPVPALRTPRGQDVRALVLISPESRVPGLNTSSASTMLRNLKMPVLIAVGKKDTQDRTSSKKLAELLMPKSEEKHVVLQQLDTNSRGVDMLNKNTGLEPLMYKFLDETVKKAAGEWRDRKSPLFD